MISSSSLAPTAGALQNPLRCPLKEGTEALLALLQCFLGPLAFGDVDNGALDHIRFAAFAALFAFEAEFEIGEGFLLQDPTLGDESGSAQNGAEAEGQGAAGNEALLPESQLKAVQRLTAYALAGRSNGCKWKC